MRATTGKGPTHHTTGRTLSKATVGFMSPSMLCRIDTPAPNQNVPSADTRHQKYTDFPAKRRTTRHSIHTNQIIRSAKRTEPVGAGLDVVKRSRLKGMRTSKGKRKTKKGQPALETEASVTFTNSMEAVCALHSPFLPRSDVAAEITTGRTTMPRSIRTILIK